MDKDIKKLVEEFKRISNKGWIKSSSNSHGAVGNVFEKELGKQADALYFPDYYGIEIKCTTRYSKYPLYLFTVAFDGPTFPEINRLIDSYGWSDKDFKEKKVLFANVKCNSKSIINNKYKFRLDIDENEEKMFLCIYDLNDNLLERKSFVYIDSLYNHLCLKLKKLATIKAFKKKTDNYNSFRYYYIAIYKLISFERFIVLLQNGYINASIIARMNKSGVDVARYRNKNLVFSINKKNINLLFEKVYSYNCDYPR